MQSNIARITAQIQQVRIKAEFDTSQLSGAAAAFDAQKIHIAAVTRELELQRQKLIQLRTAMFESAQRNGGNNVQTINIKSNVLTQLQEIQRLETKLKELQNTDVNLKIQADNFQKAEQTVNENIARINTKIKNIRIQAEIDTSRIKDAGSFFDAQKVHIAAVTREIELQREKLIQLQAQMRDAAKAFGSESTRTLNIKSNVLQQEQELQRLEQKLKELQSTDVNLKIRADSIRQTEQSINEKIANINSQIKNVKIQAEIDTTKLGASASEFDKAKIHVQALTRELELQREKYYQLQRQAIEAAKNFGGDSTITLNLKSNFLQQYQEIQRLETKLKELQNTNVNLKIQADNFQKAEQTINENIERINAKIEHIRVKTEVDTSKLGASASEFDKAKIHVQALTRELELQTQKLRELQKAFATSVSTNGLNNVKTINLGTDIQRQIQEINQLKAKLDELSKIKPPNGLLNGYLNIKGDIAGKLNNITSAFNGVASASHSADGAISKALEIIGAIPHPVGKAVAALASLPLIIKGIESSLLSMAESVVAAGDSFYVMSRGMQLSIADAAQLSTIAKVTGIDINEVNTVMRRFSMQLTKGGEKSTLMEQTLKRYGAELTDETGRLKNELELAQELGKALRAAEEEGNGAAFRDIVGGKFWSGDTVTFFEDLEANTEAAKKVVKNGLANPKFAHDVQGEINTLNTQLGQLGGVFESALLPVVHEIVPRMTERFGELTKVIQANKENIRFFGDALALPVRVINEMTDGVISLSKAIDDAKDKGTALGQFFATIGNYRDDVAALMNVAPTTALTAIFSPSPGATELAIAAYRTEIEEYKKAQEEADKAAEAKKDEAAARHANTLALNKANLEARQKLATALASSEERRVKFAQEAEDTIFGIRSSSYEKQLREHERWQDEELAKIQELQELGKNILGKKGEGLFDDEEAAFYELDNAKILQIEQEKEQRLDEIRQRITSAEQTEAERRMAAIDAEKEKWIQAGMGRAEAEQLAEKQKTQVIKQLEADVAANMNSIWQTELENRLAQIDREKQAWIQKGVDEVKATEWAEQAKADAQRNAAMNVLKSQGKEYAAYQRGGLEGLEAYKLKQLRKSGVRREFLDMTPEQLQDFQRASSLADKSLLPNFMTDKDRDHYQRFKNGLPLDEPAVEGLTKSLSELPTAAQGTTESLSEMTAAVQTVTETLNELPTATSQGAENTSESPTKASPADNGENSVTNSGENALYESLSKLEPEIENVTLQLSAMAEELQLTAEALSKITPPQTDSATALSPQPATEANAASNPFSTLEPEIAKVANQFSNMNTGVQNVTKNFSSMNIGAQAATKNFSDISTSAQGTTQKFSDMSTGLQNVTIKVDNLAAALQELTNRAKEKTVEKDPVEVTTNVQIDEATAWDSEHIQELADKVADKIRDAVVSAIGGDSNSY